MSDEIKVNSENTPPRKNLATLGQVKDALDKRDEKIGSLNEDLDAIIKGLESGKLAGFGADTLEGEGNVFFKNLNGQEIADKNIEKLVQMFPKVLLTPHMGSYTDEALTNMISISYDNLNDYLVGNECKNAIA